MEKNKLTKGKAARIILETRIIQEGEVFQNTFDEMGRIVSVNNNYYLRFVETNEAGEIPTLIKISSDGNVHITRHAEHRTRLEFNEAADTYTHYQTPAGLLKMRVRTQRMDLTYQASPFAGEVEIDYLIYAGEQAMGNYQMRLRFTT